MAEIKDTIQQETQKEYRAMVEETGDATIEHLEKLTEKMRVFFQRVKESDKDMTAQDVVMVSIIDAVVSQLEQSLS